MAKKEDLQRKLVNALNKRVQSEERLKEFLKPMIEAMKKGQLAEVKFDTLPEYDRLNKEFEQAFKEYNELFRKYLETSKGNTPP